MAYKFEIVNNSLRVTDTLTNDVIFNIPKRDAWYIENRLQFNVVLLYGVNGHERTQRELNLLDCVDANDVEFTKDSFRNFMSESVSNDVGGGVVCLYEAETATLLNGAELDSGWLNVANINGLLVNVTSDNDGITLVQTNRNSDTGIENTTTVPLPSTLTDLALQFPTRSNQVRFQFKNNSGVTVTNLKVIVKGKDVQPSILPLEFNPLPQSQAILTQSVAIGKDSTGTYRNQRVTSLGANVSSLVPFETALGNVPGSTTWNKFGYNNDIDNGSIEVVASFGGTFNPPTVADTMNFVSTSANDAVGGTGVRTIVITGIDENRVSQVEVLNLNGTTPVTTLNQWLGVNTVSPFICGSVQSNDGTITGSLTTSGQILAEMPSMEGSTQQCIFYIQNGYRFLVTWLHINVLKLAGGSSAKVTVKGWVFNSVANAKILVFETKIDTSVENTVEINPSEPFPITESSVFWIEATSDTNNTEIDCRFSGIEVKNE